MNLIDRDRMNAEHIEIFRRLNACHNYRYKQEYFYPFKHDVLKKYGTYRGYEIQIIQKECFSCNGTGVFKYRNGKKERCHSCINGIYAERKYILDNFKLGDYTFHVPVSCERNIRFIGYIQGYVKHKPETINFIYYLLVLFWHYDRNRFWMLLKKYHEDQRGKTKMSFNKLMQKPKGVLEKLKLYFFEEEKTTDDLPF